MMGSRHSTRIRSAAKSANTSSCENLLFPSCINHAFSKRMPQKDSAQ